MPVDNNVPWTFEEERALLLVRAEEEVVNQIQGTSRDTQVYRLIADRMSEHGYERNKKQVKNKLKYIKTKWQKVARSIGRVAMETYLESTPDGNACRVNPRVGAVFKRVP